MSITDSSLPNLVFVGDVPVENSYHGSALLYRLFGQYPREKCLILEGNLWPSQEARRLKGYRYQSIQVGRERWLRSRISKGYSTWLLASAGLRVSGLEDACRGYSVEGVVAVAHGYSWISAARFARRREVPFHLIVHDDWPRCTVASGLALPFVDRIFSQIYRFASTRFCVSRQMEETYRTRYGVGGTVLYPFRALDCPQFPTLDLNSVRASKRPVTFAYAGSLNTPDYVRSLAALASAVEVLGGKLLLYGPTSPEQLGEASLRAPHVEWKGLVRSDQLIRVLRDQADILFVPMSFEDRDRVNMQLSFPSKLTDYTACGLPMIIYGPSYSSAVRWARDNPGAALVVDQPETSALVEAAFQLARDPDWRTQLGHRAQQLGNQFFSPTEGKMVFVKNLVSVTPRSVQQELPFKATAEAI